MEEEARLTKNDFYPLMRDIRNLRTFAVNLNNILQAAPDRFAVAAPPGLIAVRNSVKNLLAAINAIKEVNNVAVEQSAVAERLAQHSMVPVLFSAERLHVTASGLVVSIDQANDQLNHFHGYLVPLFVFTLALCPVVDIMVRQATSAENQLAELKLRLNWLAEQEVISGLPEKIEARLGELRPRLRLVESELAEISRTMSEISTKMDQLSILNAKLEPLIRMAAVMDGALLALPPVMTMLKQLTKAFAGLKRKEEKETLQEYLEREFTQARLPTM